MMKGRYPAILEDEARAGRPPAFDDAVDARTRRELVAPKALQLGLPAP
jgi:hypothetical protein